MEKRNQAQMPTLGMGEKGENVFKDGENSLDQKSRHEINLMVLLLLCLQSHRIPCIQNDASNHIIRM